VVGRVARYRNSFSEKFRIYKNRLSEKRSPLFRRKNGKPRGAGLLSQLAFVSQFEFSGGRCFVKAALSVIRTCRMVKKLKRLEVE
jgi:hypothetical protein